MIGTGFRASTLLAAMLWGAALAQPPALPSVPHDRHQPKPKPETPAKPEGPKGSLEGGVLHPPDLDPGIQAPGVPAPAPNTMPVIPPPGSPGSDPRIEPR